RYGFEAYLPSATRTFTFGERDRDDVRILRIEERRDGSSFIQVSYRQEVVTFTVPFVDKASIENVLICLTTMLFLGYSLDAILHKLGWLRPLEMRLQLKTGRNNCSIIDDTYSNDLASLQIALDFLNQQQQHKKKTLILSDMEGLNHKLQAKLLSILEQQNLSRIILVGKSMQYLEGKVRIPLLFFDSTEELIRN